MEKTPYYHTASVFGPTGLVGKQLVLQLIKETTFSKIKVFTRRPLNFEHEKVVEILIDFSDWGDIASNLFSDEIVFCCVGTTISKAGSKEQFKKVDLELPVKIAQHARNRGVMKYIVVSSVGANPDSNNFYLRTKGEMENEVKNTGMAIVSFVRPSMLLGDREEFRLGEETGKFFMKTFSFAFKGRWEKYKGIEARDVARAMIRISGFTHPKLVYESDELQAMVTQEKEAVQEKE